MNAGAPAPLTDRELVAAVRDGDRVAFVAVYDRYGDKLYDFAYATTRHPEDAADAVADTFVRFAERLAQLRDPDALRPWLYSITRHECLRLIRSRKRIAFGSEERLAEVVDSGRRPDDEAERVALRALVWDAAAGLADRDRAMLDLHLRQGLDGAELGQAMGMSAAHAYVQLNRLRTQMERSLGALLVARTGRADCATLDRLLGDWDGTLTPLIRKRMSRHVEGCETCSGRRRRMVSPLALLASVPLVLAPADLRDRVLDQAWPIAVAGAGSATGGVAPATRTGPNAATVTAIVAGSVALVLFGSAALMTSGAGLFGGGPSTPTAQPTGGLPVAAGRLALSTTQLDLGLDAVSGSVTVSNLGGRLLDVAVQPVEPWLRVDVATTRIAPGDSVALTVHVDRSLLPPGPAVGTVDLVADGRTVQFTVGLIQPAPPPEPIAPSVSAPAVVSIQCVGITRTVSVSADVDAEVDLSSVELYWNNTAGSGGTAGSGSVAMTWSGSAWVADIGPFAEGADVTMVVEAVDVRGLAASGPDTSATMPIGVCT